MRRFSIKTSNYGYLFLLPFFTVFFIFLLYPIIYSFYISLTNLSETNPHGDFIGFGNYINLFTDKFFLRSIINTWRIWIVCFIPQFSLALGMAAILTRDKIRGKSLFRGIYFVAELVTAASIGILFNILLGWKNGTINNFLVVLRIIRPEDKIHFLANPVWLSTSLSMIMVWMWFGYGMIFFIAGILAVPKDLFDAAAIDGANAWNSFWKITIPQIKPIMIYIIVTNLIGAMNNFDIPYVFGEEQSVGGFGGPKNAILTIVYYIYNVAFRGAEQRGYAASIVFVLFIMTIILCLIIFRVMTGRKYTK